MLTPFSWGGVPPCGMTVRSRGFGVQVFWTRTEPGFVRAVIKVSRAYPVGPALWGRATGTGCPERLSLASFSQFRVVRALEMPGGWVRSRRFGARVFWPRSEARFVRAVFKVSLPSAGRLNVWADRAV